MFKNFEIFLPNEMNFFFLLLIVPQYISDGPSQMNRTLNLGTCKIFQKSQVVARLRRDTCKNFQKVHHPIKKLIS